MPKGHSLLGSAQAHLRRGGGNVIRGCRITGTYLTFSASVFFPGLSLRSLTFTDYPQEKYIRHTLALAIGNGAFGGDVTLTTFVNI